MKWIQSPRPDGAAAGADPVPAGDLPPAEPFGHSVFLSGELNHFGEMDCFFLGYEGQALAAVLTLFQPDAREAEVTAFVAPTCGGRGALPRSLPPPGQSWNASASLRCCSSTSRCAPAGEKCSSAFQWSATIRNI